MADNPKRSPSLAGVARYFLTLKESHGRSLIVVTKLKVLEGLLEDLSTYYKKVIEIFEANEPQPTAWHGFLKRGGSE